MGNAEQNTRRRLVTVLSVVLLGSVVGYFMGLRQPPKEPTHQSFGIAVDGERAPLARSNRELATHPWSDDMSPWVADRSVPKDYKPVTPRDAVAREAALARRSSRRAFEGAPPTIVHPVGQGSAVECLACHETGATIGTVVAPPMSHPAYAMCTQCHVVEATSIPFAASTEGAKRPGMTAVASDFVGMRGATDPYRWTKGAPPQTPHSTKMREKCGSCHGPYGLPGLQTSHPERQSCQQCHAPSQKLDQAP